MVHIWKREEQPGHALTSATEVTEASPIPEVSLAQETELFALTQACLLAKDKIVNMYSRQVICIWDCTVFQNASETEDI